EDGIRDRNVTGVQTCALRSPRFRDRARKQALAAAFEGQGEDYDRLRPGYPGAALEAMLARVHVRSDGGPPRAVDLGAGTGKLSRSEERRVGKGSGWRGEAGQ